MSEKELTDLIERIKERRLKLEMSYQDLSDATGISKSTLQRYETGYIKKVPINQIEILAKALHTTPSYLMGWDNTVTEAPSVPLTPRDERQIAADLEKMLADLDSKNSMAAMALGIKPSQLMGTSGPRIVKMPPIELNQPERELITKYRKLTDVAQDRVQKMVDFELYQQQQAAQEDAQKDARSCG